jgi:hypothetical protein
VNRRLTTKGNDALGDETHKSVVLDYLDAADRCAVWTDAAK